MYSQTDPPGAAPGRGRSVMSTIALIVQLCSSWQDFKWRGRSRGPSAIDTQRPTSGTDSVNRYTYGNRRQHTVLCSLPRSRLVHTVNRFAVEGQFSCDHLVIWMCFMCLSVKQHIAFKGKYAISGFPVSTGGEEVLVRWGRKTLASFDCLFSQQHFCQILQALNLFKCRSYSKP